MTQIKRTMHDMYPFISPQQHLRGAATHQTILITGGGKGVGRAMTHQFARAGAGAIYITGRDGAALDETAASVARAVPACAVRSVVADVTSEEGVGAIFAMFGESAVPDVLINNAGVSLNQLSITDGDPALWWQDWVRWIRMETDAGAHVVNRRSTSRACTCAPGRTCWRSTAGRASSSTPRRACQTWCHRR